MLPMTNQPIAAVQNQTKRNVRPTANAADLIGTEGGGAFDVRLPCAQCSLSTDTFWSMVWSAMSATSLVRYYSVRAPTVGLCNHQPTSI
jgi:hypothetical protein